MSGAPLYKAPEPPPKKKIAIIGGPLRINGINNKLLDSEYLKSIEKNIANDIAKKLNDIPKPPPLRVVR